MHAGNMEDNHFKKVIKEVKFQYGHDLSGITFHSLRHTYATYLLSKGVTVKYIQEQLGHSTSRTTLDIYSHVMPSVRGKAIEYLEQIEPIASKSPQNKKRKTKKL